MPRNTFRKQAMAEGHPDWETATARASSLYGRAGDLRSPFQRDYNRILHCTAFRRLKHKTQVFFATTDDHICTRIEHVDIVSAVSYTIANALGLNTELTAACSIGHDLGHAPFGHAGEGILTDLRAQDRGGERFWHERNSLRFVDHLETLQNPKGEQENLDLTYAVRDGIVCHCGEVDENGLRPRAEALDLEDFRSAGEHAPYTWEGCVVKLADKIAYLGRDLEDALYLGILDEDDKQALLDIVDPGRKVGLVDVSNTLIMHRLIKDVCTHSTPEDGIRLSPESVAIMDALKDFNYRRIYRHPRVERFKRYAELVLATLHEALMDAYAGADSPANVAALPSDTLARFFGQWLEKYRITDQPQSKRTYRRLYDLECREDYADAVTDFLSGMTDSFAIKAFNELIRF